MPLRYREREKILLSLSRVDAALFSGKFPEIAFLFSLEPDANTEMDRDVGDIEPFYCLVYEIVAVEAHPAVLIARDDLKLKMIIHPKAQTDIATGIPTRRIAHRNADYFSINHIFSVGSGNPITGMWTDAQRQAGCKGKIEMTLQTNLKKRSCIDGFGIIGLAVFIALIAIAGNGHTLQRNANAQGEFPFGNADVFDDQAAAPACVVGRGRYSSGI